MCPIWKQGSQNPVQQLRLETPRQWGCQGRSLHRTVLYGLPHGLRQLRVSSISALSRSLALPIATRSAFRCSLHRAAIAPLHRAYGASCPSDAGVSTPRMTSAAGRVPRTTTSLWFLGDEVQHVA